MKKPLSLAERMKDRMRGEWVLCRRVFKQSAILRVNGDDANTDDFVAEILGWGPGEYRNGTFVKVEGLVVGDIVVVPGNHCIQGPNWKEEHLFACPDSSIITTMEPLEDEYTPTILLAHQVIQ